MTGAERVAKRRAALRAQGLRPKTIWVPDVRSPEFMAQAHRDCEIMNAEASRYPQLYALAEAISDEVFATIPPWEDDD